jgi:hypothetical protein
MPSIVCHPDNWEAVKAKIDRGQFDKPGSMFAVFEVRTNPQMERDKPTGRYKLPSGKAVAKDEIVVKERFVEYGPEDFEWLIYAGIVTEEREMVFYVIDDAMIRMSYDFAPIMPDRRVIFNTVS